MRKKLATLLSTLFILTCMIPVSSAAEFTDITDNENSIAIKTVCGLGIMEEAEYGMFSPEGYVTRGDVAVAVGKLMKFDCYSDGETSFADVPSGAEESGYINTLQAMGIMLGYNDTYFGYEDTVTLEQIETVILRATGYMALDGIMTRGKMLAEADFLDDVNASPSDKLTRADVAQLLYNCLDVKEMCIDYKGSYFQGKTVLENRQGLIRINGVMTANSITRLSSSGGVEKGHIEINSVNYKTSYAQADELLGYPVEAYYETENDVIIYMHDVPSEYEIVDVDDYDIVSIDTDGANVTVKYEYNSKIKTKVFGISDNIMYNGTAISALTNDALNINMGKIKVIEPDSGGRNVFIESYEDYVVEYVNTDEKTIVDRLTRQKISFDYEENIRFYKFGYETTFDQINNGEVLSVYDNGDKDSRNIIVYISDDRETGKITAIDEEFVYINGKTYRLAAGADLTNAFSRGFTGSFYIDASGRIIGADNDDNTGFQYGCLVNIKYEWAFKYGSDSEKDFLTFKILGTNGQVVDYPASKKLLINGVKVYKDWENFPFDLFLNNGEFFNQLIKFRIDYEGKVSLIYTENQDFEDSPQAKNDFMPYRYRQKSGGMFDSKSDTMLSTTSPGFFVDASTVIFSVPNEHTGNAADYKVITASSFREMATYNSKPYDVDEYSVAKVLMLTSADRVTEESAIVGVNSISEILNSNNETVQGIKVVGNNKTSHYELHHNVTTKIKEGDIIQINVDGNGTINAVNVVENAKEISELIPDDDFHYDFAAGTVYGVSDDYLRLDFSGNKSLSFKLTNATQYYIYRKDRQRFEIADKKSVSVGNMALVQVLTGYASNVFVFVE